MDETQVLRRVAHAALLHVKGESPDREKRGKALAKPLTAANDLPGIAAIRRRAHDDRLTIWQAAKLVAKAVVENEIASLNALVAAFEVGEREARGRVSESDRSGESITLTFLCAFFKHGETLSAMGRTFNCDASTVLRTMRRPIFDGLVDCIVEHLAEERQVVNDDRLIAMLEAYAVTKARVALIRRRRTID